jgi:thiosulfate/3-mercaptopyruvate sulfurtransferase
MTKPIVTVQWLNKNLANPNIVVLDASQGKTASGKVSNFENVQIFGSMFFDLKNTFSDQNSDYSNMLPSPQLFETECQKLGINKSSIIIVYDNLGIYYGPRVWWMFKTMGHDKVFVLDGGLPEWNKAKYELVKNEVTKSEIGNFKSNFKADNVKALDFILQNIKSEKAIIIDARSEDRFFGRKKEPRPNAKSGHIPRSINIHYDSVLKGNTFKSSSELSSVFGQKKINDKPLVFTCGSGVTACILFLASELVLKNSKSIYDGSWNEWSQVDGLPIG